jgi:hypothetical protein
MKSKRLIQVLVVFVLLMSTMGGSGSASASTSTAPQADAMVINRNLNFWDATYIGFVNGSIHEKWHFDFTATHTFVVTVTPITGTSDLVPLLILQNAGGTELARGTSTLTSTQGPGSYSLQIQPESGSGFYVLTLREVLQTNPSVVTTISPSGVNVGEVAVATVSLNNVPAEGYTSAEFTCTYDASLVDVGTPVASSLFGADPVAAFNESQPGSFIFAIAGSNGNKATTSGAVFTFSVTGLVAGQTPIECDARVSKGDNILTDIDSVGTTLTVTGSGPTATFTPTAVGSETATPVASPTATSLTPVGSPTATSLTPDASPTATSLTPVGSPTATSLTPVASETPSSTPVVSPTATSLTPSETPIFTATSTPVETATPSSTPIASPTLTATPLPDGSVSGHVVAAKPVTVGLYDGSNNLVTSVTAGNDGSFSLSAPAGTYTIRAVASGYLSAEGPVTLTSGNNATKPTVTLLAGDIDGNNVIDQFDAMTIGMSYNTSTPAAADLNNDNVINVLDLELLAQNYRETGPIVW